MKRFAIPALIVIVLTGSAFALAANDADPESDSSKLAGKYVIITKGSTYFGVSENVRYRSMGKHDFLVIPMRHRNTEEAFDYWLPLAEVDNIKVFHSRKDAISYDEKTSPTRRSVPPGNAGS